MAYKDPEYQKKWKSAHPEYWKEYRRANTGPHNNSAREYSRRLRKRVVDILGGKCCKCDFGDERALQVDHVNGGGKKEKDSMSSVNGYYRIVIKSTLEKEGRYQLLCANCNWIKRVENKEHNQYPTN